MSERERTAQRLYSERAYALGLTETSEDAKPAWSQLSPENRAPWRRLAGLVNRATQNAVDTAMSDGLRANGAVTLDDHRTLLPTEEDRER